MTVTTEPQIELELEVSQSNWTQSKLDQVCLLITDGTHFSPPNGPVGDYMYVTAKNIKKWGLDVNNITYIDKAIHRDIYSRSPVNKGDVLYIKDGATTGLAVINHLEEEFSLLSSVALIKTHPELLEPRFLKHWLNDEAVFKSMVSDMTGTAIKRLVLKQIRSVEIPLPPLPEQVRIADKLDTLLARVDAGRERLERVPKLIKRFRQSVLSAAVSGELTREWRGGRDVEWEATLLNSLAHSITDGDHQAPPQATSGIPFITISAINDATLRLEKSTRFVPPSYLAALKATRVAKLGDILFSVTGSICIPAIVDTDQPFVFQRHIAIIKPNFSKISGKCLYYFLASPEIRKQGEEMATGTAQPTVSLSSLKAFEIPLPPLPEQAEIVRRVEALFAFADRLEARYASALSSFNRLTPALLAKAFRGELVPQDPNDEHASALLKRIQAQRAADPKAKGSKAAKAVREDGAEPKRRGRSAKAQAEVGAANSGSKPRGRPRGTSTAISQASSIEEAIRTLETQKLERAQGTRQVSLFGTED